MRSLSDGALARESDDRTSANEPDVEQLAHVLGVLATPVRLRIVGLVAERALSGNEVAEALGISQALACHHLNKLAECGLVRRRREGQARFSLLDRDLLGRYLALIRGLAGLDRDLGA